MEARERRAKRALDRQLAFMRGLAMSFRGRESQKHERLKLRAAQLLEKLAPFREIQSSDTVLEVGSGASGYIFHLGLPNVVGVDPLADHCRELFSLWQTGVKTIAAPGESLPFDDQNFDIVICDNVIDHAENPHQIVREIMRVLKPGGLFYFTVHVHHPIYTTVSTAYGLWHSTGLPPEITPFADHTVHLTPASARKMFQDLPLTVKMENYIDAQRFAPRHVGDRLKRLFYKNRTWEVVGIRSPDAAA
ncbi:MAG TPA: class I SAM-dependent methyltransferase [Allosphingosinicella sp.]